MDTGRATFTVAPVPTLYACVPEAIVNVVRASS